MLHLPPHRPSRLVEVLSARAALPVREPDDKEPLAPGVVYVAPPGYHLLVERDATFSLSVDEAVNFSRPSLDVLFESAADALGASLVGVVLSGASDDGAAGLAAIARAGGVTIVQAPASAEVPTMPEAALAALTPHHILPPERIGSLLAAPPPLTAQGAR